MEAAGGDLSDMAPETFEQVTATHGLEALETIRTRLDRMLGDTETAPLIRMAMADAKRYAARGDWAALVCKAERAHVVHRCEEGLECRRCLALVREDS
jgi:hypothetical protein